MTENTKTMLLDMLVEQLDNEPPKDYGTHPSMELHERAGAAWAQWDKHVEASRLLLGSLLVNDAIEQRREHLKHERRSMVEALEQQEEARVVTSEVIRSSELGSTWSNPDTDAVFEWTGDRLAKHIGQHALSAFDSMHAVDIDRDWFRLPAPPIGDYTEEEERSE